MNNIVWCISTGVLIFLVGFNLGGVAYCSIHNNPTKYVRSALLISIITIEKTLHKHVEYAWISIHSCSN